MFIRKSPIKSKKTGGSYFSYRLVENRRVAGKVKQRTLLNLGKYFDVDQAQWHLLAERIDQIICGDNAQQLGLLHFPELDSELETKAQRYATLLLAKLSAPILDSTLDATSLSDDGLAHDYHRVDVNRLALSQARSIGAETLSVSMFEHLQLDETLAECGFNQKERAAAKGVIIGRMIHPASERETHRWLQQNSALGELTDIDYQTLSLDRLYQVGDKLLSHKKAIEVHLTQREASLFNLKRTIILYDLTNTFFEGQATSNAQAVFGRSKEKRSDCPLVTMGLVLDGDGFPLASEIFAGNASEPKTLQTMVEQLSGTASSTGLTKKSEVPESKGIVVLDAGIASQDNLRWLTDKGYQYIVVSRERYKERPDLDSGAVVVKDIVGDQVIAKRVLDTETGEVRLFCHSQKREKKEQAIETQFTQRFEAKLSTLNDGLSKKGTIKKYEKILKRVGSIEQKYARIAKDYDIEVVADDEKKHALNITWSIKPARETQASLSGVYCLRTTVTDLSEQELWQTYTMLTDVEACFKSMKSELGLRPIYHQKKARVNAHIFITLLAYHLVHSIRVQLRTAGIRLSWNSLRNYMSTQQRVSVTLPTEAGLSVHIRSTTKAEPVQQAIYKALEIKADRLGSQKSLLGD
jgi:transposase